MGFQEDWQAWHKQQQEQKAVAAQQAVMQARENWQGRRVWVWGVDSVANVPKGVFPQMAREWLYGLVEQVDDRGRVQVLRGYAPNGQPLYWWGELSDLGELIVLAE